MLPSVSFDSEVPLSPGFFAAVPRLRFSFNASSLMLVLMSPSSSLARLISSFTPSASSRCVRTSSEYSPEIRSCSCFFIAASESPFSTISLPKSNSPFTVTVPPEGTSSRFRQRRKVDLPLPEGPIIATFSPIFISQSMPRRTSLLPKRLVRLRVDISTFSSLILRRSSSNVFPAYSARRSL